MSINRIGTANMYDSTINNLGSRQSNLVDLMEKTTAGKRVLRASDDPVAAAQAERETTAQLLPLLDKLGLICGVSGAFSNLYEANQAWFQATSALQNGFLQDGNGTVFYFQDYLLPQLLFLPLWLLLLSLLWSWIHSLSVRKQRQRLPLQVLLLFS